MLQAHKAATIKDYYKNFVSISGALAAVTGLEPLLSFLPFAAAGYVFPPLGDATGLARTGVLCLSMAMTYLAFYFPIARCRWIMVCLFGISGVALCCYLISYMQFVRKIEVPSAAATIQVSVGEERTPFAAQTFGAESDWDMLRARGTGEEEVWKLWTARSILHARLSLLGSFSGFILPLVLIFSLGVRRETPDGK
jgi:hypothetical protein